MNGRRQPWRSGIQHSPRGSERRADANLQVAAADGAHVNERGVDVMKLKVVVHEAEEGGYWAEVPSIPGCATQGDSYEELLANVHEVVEGCLSVDVRNVAVSATDRIIEIAV